MKKILIVGILLIVISGCAHEFKYNKPATQYDILNSITINKTKDEVWSKLVLALSKTFFTINNLDKESGLINVSYSGNPEVFVDCGEIYSLVANIHGERIYRFPASTAYKEYEIWTDTLTPVKRSMELEGKINIVIQEIAPQQTKVSIHTKYVLNKTFATLVHHYHGYSSYSTWNSFSDSISFNTGEIGVFKGGATECRCNGELERLILNSLSDN